MSFVGKAYASAALASGLYMLLVLSLFFVLGKAAPKRACVDRLLEDERSTCTYIAPESLSQSKVGYCTDPSYPRHY